MTPARMTHPQRLEHDVLHRDRSDCWLDAPWQHDNNGYGLIWVGKRAGDARRYVRAHILAKEMDAGGHPEGMQCLHTCDTPRCYNPDHIFWGTHADNMADMRRKRRSTWGERNPKSKVTEEQVREIRRRYRSRSEGGQPGELQRLADEFGLSRSMVLLIARRESWKHVA